MHAGPNPLKSTCHPSRVPMLYLQEKVPKYRKRRLARIAYYSAVASMDFLCLDPIRGLELGNPLTSRRTCY